MVAAALAAPAIADYSGDHPLTTYEHGMLNSGGIMYETVTDGSLYMKNYPVRIIHGSRVGSTTRTSDGIWDLAKTGLIRHKR